MLPQFSGTQVIAMLLISFTKTFSRPFFHPSEHHTFQKMSHVIDCVVLEATTKSIQTPTAAAQPRRRDFMAI